MRPPVPEGQPVTKVVTWNVAGLRAILKRVREERGEALLRTRRARGG